jgi:hypothetical protein
MLSLSCCAAGVPLRKFLPIPINSRVFPTLSCTNFRVCQTLHFEGSLSLFSLFSLCTAKGIWLSSVLRESSWEILGCNTKGLRVWLLRHLPCKLKAQRPSSVLQRTMKLKERGWSVCTDLEVMLLRAGKLHIELCGGLSITYACYLCGFTGER